MELEGKDKLRADLLKEMGLEKDKWGNLFKDGEFIRNIGTPAQKLDYIIDNIINLTKK